MNLLYPCDLDIIKGKWLFQVLSVKSLDYLLEKKKMKKEETKIAILVNDLTENIIGSLRQIAKQYKMVSIITNHREKFKKLEKQILEEDGIMITTGNNKKKGLSKAELILNVDFPTELINQYTIYENAIIMNLQGDVRITKKRFNGICINNYEIEQEKEEDFDYDKKTKYRACEIYEATMNKRQPYQELLKQIEKDKVKITALIGNNSKL